MKFYRNTKTLGILVMSVFLMISFSLSTQSVAASSSTISVEIEIPSMNLYNNGENGNVWIWGRLSTFEITTCPSNPDTYEAYWTPLVYADESIYTPITYFDYETLKFSGTITPSSSGTGYVYGLLCAIDDTNPDEIWRGKFHFYGDGSGNIMSPTPPGNINYGDDMGLSTISAYYDYEYYNGLGGVYYYNRIYAEYSQVYSSPPVYCDYLMRLFNLC